MPKKSVLKSEGGRKRLVIDFRGSPNAPDIAQYPQAMKDVIELLRDIEADEIVLSEYYERIYDAGHTALLKEIAELINKFEADEVWSPSHLGLTANSKILS